MKRHARLIHYDHTCTEILILSSCTIIFQGVCSGFVNRVRVPPNIHLIAYGTQTSLITVRSTERTLTIHPVYRFLLIEVIDQPS